MVDYELLARQMEQLLEGEDRLVPVLANASALLMDAMPGLNWAGFYLLEGGELLLGPFQGRPACVHIPLGKGVCGTAFERGASIRVEDVHAFSGHIACDSASKSELVVIQRDSAGRPIGVLDLDSPKPCRFTEGDRLGVELVSSVIARHCVR